MQKVQQMTDKHGPIMGYLLQNLSVLQFKSAEQAIQYLNMVDMYATHKAPTIPSQQQFIDSLGREKE